MSNYKKLRLMENAFLKLEVIKEKTKQSINDSTMKESK